LSSRLPKVKAPRTGSSTITNTPGPGTDVPPPQHCDVLTIRGSLPPPLTGAQYAIRGVQGTTCCPKNQTFFYQAANTMACCNTPLQEAAGVKYCPYVEELSNRFGPFPEGFPTFPGTAHPDTHPLRSPSQPGFGAPGQQLPGGRQLQI